MQGLGLVLSYDSSTTKEEDMSLVSFSDDVSLVNAVEEMSFQEMPTLATTVSNELKWLLVYLPKLPHFEIVKPICCYALRQVRGNYESLVLNQYLSQFAHKQT